MYLNKAYIIGNLTRDPEMKALPSGMNVTSFSLATNRTWKDQSGAKQESTDYHNIVVFGRQAETTAQYLKKGSSALVEGRIQTRSWDGQDGKKQYRTEIVAERIQFGPSNAGGTSGAGSSDSFGKAAIANSGADSEGSEADSKKPKKSGALDAMESVEYPVEDINPEDIPF